MITRLHNRPEATWTYFGGFMRTDATTKQWFYANALGSISAVADNSGNVLEQHEYDPQGHVQVADGSGTAQTGTQIGNYIAYTDRNYDYETGNYFYRARYYSPDLGRFISRDPLSGAESSQGTNLYAYCGNDPVNFADPTGMDKRKVNKSFTRLLKSILRTKAGQVGWQVKWRQRECGPMIIMMA